jgi:putative membrane protein
MFIKPIAAIFITLSVSVAALAAAEMPAQTFAQKAAQTDMFEIEAAKLVLDKGHSEEEKKFASDMVKDHQRTTMDLKRAATKDRVELPSNMGKELREKFESLKPLTGPTLDAAYVSTQVSVHAEAVELFDKFSKDGQGGALKSLAMAYYPTIRMHLVRVRNFNVEQ